MSIFNSGLIMLNGNKNLEELDKTILIIGQARAGSTMVSSVINQMGIPVGKDYGPVHEDNDLGKYVKDLTNGNLSKAFIKEIRKRNNLHEKWCWKRPDMYNFIDVFINQIRNPCLIAIFRDPVSITSRNQISLSMQKNSLDDCLKSFHDTLDDQKKILEKINNLKLPSLLISYEKAISNPTHFISELKKFVGCEEIESTSAELLSIISPNHPGYALRARKDEYLPNNLYGVVSGMTHAFLNLTIKNSQSEDKVCGFEVWVDGVNSINKNEILVKKSNSIKIKLDLSEKLQKKIHSIKVNFKDNGEVFLNSPFTYVE